jgi:hypothetical protein
MRPLLLALLLPAATVLAAPGLTIYNQNFAVVRDTIPLDLKAGINEVTFDGATVHLEPDSVMLRDPAGNPLQILEQNFRNDPVTQQLLLSLFEGRSIELFVREPNKPDRMVQGKIIRTGYVSHGGAAMQRYGNQYAMNQMAMANAGAARQPIIEVDGKIQFGLPGEPVFPSLGDDTILKPRLSWKINSPKPLKTDAELGYITGGMSWQASYNVVAPEKGDTLDIAGVDTIRYDENKLIAALDLIRTETETPGSFLPMGGAMPEKLGAPQGNLYHDIRPQAFAMGSFLGALASLGIRRLPHGLALRPTAAITTLENYPWRGKTMQFAFEPNAAHPVLEINGTEFPGTLQLPESALTGPEVRIRIRPGQPTLRLVRSTIRLESASVSDGATVYSGHAFGLSERTFDTPPNSSTLQNNDGTPIAFTLTQGDNLHHLR